MNESEISVVYYIGNIILRYKSDYRSYENNIENEIILTC